MVFKPRKATQNGFSDVFTFEIVVFLFTELIALTNVYILTI